MLQEITQHSKLENADIVLRRQQVAQRILSDSSAIRDVNFSTINTRDLFDLFANYDELFFDGQLAPLFEASDHVLKFRLSSRMTSTGGMTTYFRSKQSRKPKGRSGSSRSNASKRRLGIGKQAPTKRNFEIAVSTTLLFNTRFDQPRSIRVGGVETSHRLDALQRIFEHELVHLLEMVLWDDSSCARPRFKSIVRRFFGHLESNHQLLTPSETARTEYGISAGDTVAFLHRGTKLIGIVNGINRRATVLVPDNESGEMFTDNRRYHRFYVPLHRLSKVAPIRKSAS